MIKIILGFTIVSLILLPLFFYINKIINIILKQYFFKKLILFITIILIISITLYDLLIISTKFFYGGVSSFICFLIIFLYKIIKINK